MYRGYRLAGAALSVVLFAGLGFQTDAASLNHIVNGGIAADFDQSTNSVEVVKAAAKMVWEGTPWRVTQISELPM